MVMGTLATPSVGTVMLDRPRRKSCRLTLIPPVRASTTISASSFLSTRRAPLMRNLALEFGDEEKKLLGNLAEGKGFGVFADGGEVGCIDENLPVAKLIGGDALDGDGEWLRIRGISGRRFRRDW